MTGFEGIGDFDSDDPFARWLAHQAAKGNLRHVATIHDSEVFEVVDADEANKPIPPAKSVPPVKKDKKDA